MWAGLGVTFYFIVWCKTRQAKKRKEEAQLVLLVHKIKTTISLTNLCHSWPLDLLIHKIKPTILDKLMSLTTIGSSYSQDQDNYILDKLMSLTTIGSSYSQDQANYPWQTYVTHGNWIFLFTRSSQLSLTNLCHSRPLDLLLHKIKPTILDKTYVTHNHWVLVFTRSRQLSLTKFRRHDNWVVIDNQHWQSYNTCTHTHTHTYTIWLIFFGKSLVHSPHQQPTLPMFLHYMICISQSNTLFDQIAKVCLPKVVLSILLNKKNIKWVHPKHTYSGLLQHRIHLT